MKKTAAKLVTVGMAAMMAVSFAGCGNAHKTTNRTDATKKVAAKNDATQTKKVTEAKKIADKAMMSSDFEKLINDIMEEKVEVGAHELENFVNNYGDQCSYQTLDAAAKDIFASMLKENENCDFSVPFEEKMEFVEDQCLKDNAKLETDVAYNQVVNAINNQVKEMHNNLVKAEKKAATKKAKTQKKTTNKETQMSKDFAKFMNDVLDKTSEDAAAELEAFVTTYGDQISYQGMEVAVQTNLKAMLEANDNCDFSSPYELKMERITAICEGHNKNLKTDKGYNNVVNAIMENFSEVTE